MQGKKQYQEKLFISFRLSERIPEDNFYRRLGSAIDFSFLYRSTLKYYGGEGQKSIDPVVFMKLILVGYLENLNSDRRIIENARMRMDILYFIGYDIDEELPWHSTLSRTRQLYGQEVFTEIFKAVLKQCIDKGMISGRRQAVDGFYVKANASLDSMVERLVLSDAEMYGRELDENAEKENATGEEEKEKSNSNGLKPKKNPHNKTHYSLGDPEAKMSVKPGKATALNYLGEVSVDTASHAITHIQAFTADKKDYQCLPEVIENVIENLKENELIVEEVVADTGFSNGKTLRTLKEKKITAYIPNIPQFIYERPGFSYDGKGDYYTCPNNAKLTYRGTYNDKKNYDKYYRAGKKVCNGCPLKDTCLVYNKREGGIITDTLERPYLVTMHHRMTTPKARRLMKERQSTVEPVIGTLVNYLGIKRVNCKGLASANKCLTIAAAAYNLKKLLNLPVKRHTGVKAQTMKGTKICLQRILEACKHLLTQFIAMETKNNYSLQ
ncbi:MAG: IS1182 family transposase [Verrucomicrobia bacterium]|nr:IS1182 family transposase [Verrucomicrobiota bacterium]